jgi:hypothetical protein
MAVAEEVRILPASLQTPGEDVYEMGSTSGEE